MVVYLKTLRISCNKEKSLFVHNHVSEFPAIEIISFLENAKSYVIQQAIKELRDDDEEWLVHKLVHNFFYYDTMSTLPHFSTDFIG